MAYQSPETDETDEMEEQEGRKSKKDKKRREVGSLAQVIAGINKKYGEGSLIQGRGAIIPVDAWASGLASLDLALGCGGIPRGRIIELFGMESSGKTTLTLLLAATCQRTKFPTKGGEQRDGVVAFIDAEHAFDPIWAEKIGVDTNRLIFNQPGCGEEGLDIASDLVDTGEVDLIIVDSVAALTPKEELDGEVGDHNIGAQARMMSKAMRRLASKCGETGCTIIFINQLREKIGVMFGDPNTTPGGKALKFYSSIRMEVRAGEAIEVNKKKIGRVTKVSVKKNKVGPPFTKTEFHLMYGHNGVTGPDRVRSLVLAAPELGVVTRSSSYYTFGNQKFNGFDNFYEAVAGSEEMQREMQLQFAEAMKARRSAHEQMYDEELTEALEED